MYADILRSISGVEIFPVLSLLLFVAFFTGVLIWAARADRRSLERVARLPLEPDGATPEAPSPGDVR
jgi:hypothetical protein